MSQIQAAPDPAMVIVGAGLAGDAAAEQLRTSGWTGRIVLVGDEPHRPYDRPPLSKGALTAADADDKIYLRPEPWYAQNGVELRLGTPVASLDLAGRAVALPSGERIGFHKLLLVTGARPRRLPLLEAPGLPVFYLRGFDDAKALRQRLAPGVRVAVVGGGVVGLETAASAVALGCRVTVIEAGPRIMGRSASPVVADFLARQHRRRGVDLVCDARIVSAQAQGSGAEIRLQGGRAIVADVVVVGVGVQPNVELAAAAGLVVDDGIVVDRCTRTSHPDIHAAGDAARFDAGGGVYRRAEQWRHAIDQAVVAARVMAGETCVYEEAPWAWSDQYDFNIQTTGGPIGDTDLVRGRLEDEAFTVFHLVDGRIAGATSINQAKLKRPIAQLVAMRAAIDPQILADATQDLKTLVATVARAEVTTV